METLAKMNSNTKLEYLNITIVSLVFVREVNPGDMVDYEKDTTIVNQQLLEIKMNKTTKLLITNPSNGGVSNFLLQKGELQKFQSGTKINFLASTTASYSNTATVMVKYPADVTAELQKYGKDSLATFNTGTIFRAIKSMTVKWLGDSDRKVTIESSSGLLRDLKNIGDLRNIRNLRNLAQATSVQAGSGQFMYSANTIIELSSPATIQFVTQAEMEVFQQTRFDDVNDIGAGKTLTYDKGTEIKVLKSGRVKILQDTEAILILPWRSRAEDYTWLKDEIILLMKATVFLLNDPGKVSISFLDDMKISTNQASKLIVVQKVDDGGGAFIIPCNPLCKDCDGATKNDCTGCHSNFYLQDGTCLCPSKGFAYHSIFIQDPAETSGFRSEISCKLCDISCSTCSGTGPGRCLVCIRSYYILELEKPISLIDNTIEKQ
jgi:hypothetical protein